MRIVQFTQTVPIVQRIVGGVARQADDPLAQAVQRDRHPGQTANHLFGISGGIGLAFVIDQLHAARLRGQRQLGAAQRVGKQQAIAVPAGLLPEEAGIDFLLIGKIGKRPAGLELIEAADSLLVLTPLRRIRAFAGALAAYEENRR